MSLAKAFAALIALPLIAYGGVAPAPVDEGRPPVDVEIILLNRAPIPHPQFTLGIGSRGGASGLPDVFVLAPPSTGATYKTQPTIYWYLSGDTGQDIAMELAQVSDGQLIFTKKLAGHRKAGIYSLNLAVEKSLAGEQLALRQDMQYQFSVIIKKSREDVENPRSIGFIAPVARPAFLGDRPDAVAYAAAGLWYDAVAELIDHLSRDPASVQARRQLCGLVWSQHAFYAHNEKFASDLVAQQHARDKEREQLKAFSALKWDQVK